MARVRKAGVRYVGRAYEVNSSTGTGTYITIIGPSFKACSCPGFLSWGTPCKHIKGLLESSEKGTS